MLCPHCQAWGWAGKNTEGLASPLLLRGWGHGGAPKGPGGARRLDVLYWLSLREAIRCKRPIDAKAVLHVLRDLNGRDKLTKVIQYGSRALWYYLKVYQPDNELGQKCERLFRASQSARMCFHLMRSFEEVQDGIDAWRDTRLVDWRRYASAVRAVINTLYWLYDNMAILARLKVAPHVDYDRASYNSDLAWTLDSLIGMATLMIDLYQHEGYRSELRRLQGEAKRRQEEENRPHAALDDGPAVALVAEEPEGEDEECRLTRLQEEAGQKQFVLLADLGRLFCDYLVAANAVVPLRLTRKPLTNGGIGIAGLVSALLALYKVYPMAD